MKYVTILIDRWTRLNFRTQLIFSHGLLVILSVTALGLLVNGLTEKILFRRGFDLLESTNRLSFTRFRERMDVLASAGDSCDPSSEHLWRDLLSSPHFVGFDATGAEKLDIIKKNGESLLRVASGCAKQAALLRTSWLSNLFNDRTGLGKSGETYLIDVTGSLVTESRFLKNPSPAPLPAGLAEHWQGLKKDYRGIPVLASWRKVSLGEFSGFIASEIDEAEVREPIKELFISVFAFFLAVLAAAAATVPWLAKALSKNFERAQEMEQVKNLALIEGQEKERNRISLELHDDIGQKLTALGWKVSSEGGSGAKALNDLVRALAQQVRALSGDLSSLLIQEVGLTKSLRQLLEEAGEAQRGAIKFQLNVDGNQAVHPGQKVSTAVYRVGQEALSNIVKHSRARNVVFSLSLTPGKVGLIVTDDGVGFESGERGGLGLKNMRSRAEAFGGKLYVTRNQPSGTRVEMTIPLEGGDA